MRENSARVSLGVFETTSRLLMILSFLFQRPVLIMELWTGMREISFIRGSAKLLYKE
jgi:hypothetical protein